MEEEALAPPHKPMTINRILIEKRAGGPAKKARSLAQHL
jgi:hypothetical protein